MKKALLAAVGVCVVSAAAAQADRRFSFTACVGTAFTLNTPSCVPVAVQFAGHCSFGNRFSAGAGVGLSFYEKTLVPVFAVAKVGLTRPRRFTPYLECAAGYGFAPGRKAGGGFYLSPSVGVRYRAGRRMGVSLAVGYELQKFERLKSFRSPSFSAQFVEKLARNSVSLKAGVIF